MTQNAAARRPKARQVISASHPTAVYSSTSGYTARARRLAGTAPPMKGMEAHDDHTIMTGTTIHLRQVVRGAGL